MFKPLFLLGAIGDPQVDVSSVDLPVVDVSSYTFILALLYLGIGLATAFQIIRILYFKHKLSYQFFFLFLCSLWVISRFVFFLITWPTDSNWVLLLYFTFYWIGVLLEFCTFFLLVVFFASFVHRGRWNKGGKKIAIGSFLCVNAIFFVFLVVYLTLQYLDSFASDWEITMAQAFSGAVFLVLSAVLGVYGLLVYRLLKMDKINMPFHLSMSSNMIVVLVTGILVIIFAIRSIYDFLTCVTDKFSVDITQGWNEAGLIMFLMYTFWEVIPAFLVLVLFWKIPSTGGVISTRRVPARAAVPSMPSETPQPDDSMFFGNDKRYDSDDETPLIRGTPPLYGNTPNTPYSTTPVYSVDPVISSSSDLSVNGSYSRYEQQSDMDDMADRM